VADTPAFGLSGAELRRLLVEASAVMGSVEELRARLVAEADARDLESPRVSWRLG
jgi:hypothetical protein